MDICNLEDLINVNSVISALGGHGAETEVSLDLKHGVEAKQYDDVS